MDRLFMYLIDYKPFYFYWNYVMFDLNTQIKIK